MKNKYFQGTNEVQYMKKLMPFLIKPAFTETPGEYLLFFNFFKGNTSYNGSEKVDKFIIIYQLQYFLIIS